MRRNMVGLIVLLTLGVLMAPRAAPAQPPAKMPRIGYLALRALAAEDETFKQGAFGHSDVSHSRC